MPDTDADRYHSMAWWRSLRLPMTPTRLDRVFIVHQERNLWRTLAFDDLPGGTGDFTGGLYKTKAEALSMLPTLEADGYGNDA